MSVEVISGIAPGEVQKQVAYTFGQKSPAWDTTVKIVMIDCKIFHIYFAINQIKLKFNKRHVSYMI